MLQAIKTFVILVNTGSFTLAAEKLGFSRSVISKKLSDLEAELGVRLMNRTTRRLSLTEAGEQFYNNCVDSLSTLENAVAEVRSLSTEPRGRLHVNLPMSFGVLHIAPLLGEFVARYPGIELDLDFDDRKVEVIEPGFDISIRISDLADSSLVAKRLADCPHAVVASPAYLKTFGLPESPQALTENHRIAAFRMQESALEWHFSNDKGDQQQVRLHASITTNNSLAIKEMLLSGAALARVPVFLVMQELDDGQLVNVFPQWTTLHKTIYAVFPKREFMPTKVRVFLDFLEERLGKLKT